jgi:hypothetical protein
MKQNRDQRPHLQPLDQRRQPGLKLAPPRRRRRHRRRAAAAAAAVGGGALRAELAHHLGVKLRVLVVLLFLVRRPGWFDIDWM